MPSIIFGSTSAAENATIAHGHFQLLWIVRICSEEYKRPRWHAMMYREENNPDGNRIDFHVLHLAPQQPKEHYRAHIR
jgi:galactose-1-phosphate uridylyltransferase